MHKKKNPAIINIMMIMGFEAELEGFETSNAGVKV